MTVSKQIWTPHLLHHILSMTNHDLFLHLDLGDSICIPTAAARAVCPAQLQGGNGCAEWGGACGEILVLKPKDDRGTLAAI